MPAGMILAFHSISFIKDEDRYLFNDAHLESEEGGNERKKDFMMNFYRKYVAGPNIEPGSTVLFICCSRFKRH